jgi:hypothetical protein
MKTLILLLMIIILASCKKETDIRMFGLPVKYSVDCSTDGFLLHYVDGNKKGISRQITLNHWDTTFINYKTDTLSVSISMNIGSSSKKITKIFYDNVLVAKDSIDNIDYVTGIEDNPIIQSFVYSRYIIK